MSGHLPTWQAALVYERLERARKLLDECVGWRGVPGLTPAHERRIKALSADLSAIAGGIVDAIDPLVDVEIPTPPAAAPRPQD